MEDEINNLDTVLVIDPLPTKVHAVLRLVHTDLDPAEITEMFGVQPTRFHKKGEPRRGRNGVLYAPFDEGAWLLDSRDHVRSKDINQHLSWILDNIASCNSSIHRLQDLGYKTDLMCGWFSKSFNTCPSLNVENMRRMASFRLNCWFDVYLFPPGRTEL